MLSNVIQLAGFGLVSYGVAIQAGTGWGFIVGGAASVFVGHFVDDRAATGAVRVGLWRARRSAVKMINRLRHNETKIDPSSRSPHPPIEVDPEMETWASRAARRRVARGDGKTYDGARVAPSYEPPDS